MYKSLQQSLYREISVILLKLYKVYKGRMLL